MLINERQARVLPLVYQVGRVTNGQARRMFEVCAETIRLDLARLVELGLLERRGTGRWTCYVPPVGLRVTR